MTKNNNEVWVPRARSQPSLSPHNSDHQSLIVSFVPLVLYSLLIPLEPFVHLFVKVVTAAKSVRIPASFCWIFVAPWPLGPNVFSGLFSGNACPVLLVYSLTCSCQCYCHFLVLMCSLVLLSSFLFCYLIYFMALALFMK